MLQNIEYDEDDTIALVSKTKTDVESAVTFNKVASNDWYVGLGFGILKISSAGVQNFLI